MVDLATRRVTLRGKELKLSVIEYNLLRLFVRHAGMVLTHRHILREIWGPDTTSTRIICVFTSAICAKKIEADPEHPGIDPHRTGRRSPPVELAP